ncbi:MAG: hypothetical protein EBU84_06815 [Actinobacteria bacterium]|nr:hypothetical protein [Actinomycetota bacterium]
MINDKKFWAWVGVAMFVALIVGILSCALTSHVSLDGAVVQGGDASYYHNGANLLADGHGFIMSFIYFISGESMQAADHPPLYMIYLAAFSLFGLRSIGPHQVATILLAVATVPFIACAARRMAGRITGVLAAFIAAGHPGIWSWGKLLMSESMAILCVAILIATALRVRSRVVEGISTKWDVVTLGLAISFAALSRAELLLCGTIIGFVCFMGRPVWPTFKKVVAAGIVSLIPMAPWVGYNLSRFNQPVFLSDGAGVTLAGTNCDRTYNGPLVGYWWVECAAQRGKQAQKANPDGDRSDSMKFMGDIARDYIKEHLADQPRVMGFRLARAFGFYKFEFQLDADKISDRRGKTVSRAAWYTYYGLLPLAALGAVISRRKNRVLPIVMTPLITAVITVAITFGSTRYRAISEVTFVLFAAVGINYILQKVRRTPRPGHEAINSEVIFNGAAN